MKIDEDKIDDAVLALLWLTNSAYITAEPVLENRVNS